MVTELSTTPLCRESSYSPECSAINSSFKKQAINPTWQYEAAVTDMEENVESDSNSDESYSPNSEVNADAQMQFCCDEWVPTLDMDDMQALSLLP